MKTSRMDTHVALVRCPDYDTAAVEAAVRRAVDLLGGMGRFVRPGQRVLVKPNLLMPTHPDRAIVTHPAVVRAVVLLVHEAGGWALIADNPGVSTIHYAWQRAYERTGLAAVAAETGAELNTQIVALQRPHPDGRLIKVVDTCTFVTEADVVISLPKLKTHDLMRFTGAVKNLFGTIPGLIKPSYHVKLQTTDQFADMLLDLVSFVRPALTVMDAVVGMDGDGPSAGRPFPIGALLAGADPTAVDVAAVALVGHDPLAIPTIAQAARRGWTTGRVADLDIVGDAPGLTGQDLLAGLRVSGFQIPPGGPGNTLPRTPGFLHRWAARRLVARPVVSQRCIGCDVCIANCPAQTIAKVDGRARIDPAGCIYCYCCHELCPEQAIDLRRP
ncbi:MAG: DUF362 domain-containing protein, partial [Anaerolineae bacterium]|nr:DUF362 domain-containing protein [Anaerolineae bacterium]